METTSFFEAMAVIDEEPVILIEPDDDHYYSHDMNAIDEEEIEIIF